MECTSRKGISPIRGSHFQRRTAYRQPSKLVVAICRLKTSGGGVTRGPEAPCQGAVGLYTTKNHQEPNLRPSNCMPVTGTGTHRRGRDRAILRASHLVRSARLLVDPIEVLKVMLKVLKGPSITPSHLVALSHDRKFVPYRVERSAAATGAAPRAILVARQRESQRQSKAGGHIS